MNDPSFASAGLAPRPARRRNAFEETVERLLQGLKLGIYAAGTRLPPERELAAQLGVSRATLRDALAELQGAGYLQSRRGRYGGTFAATVLPGTAALSQDSDAADVQDVLLFRRVVEPAAARLAAEATLTAAARAHLLSALAEVDEANTDTFRPKDSRFHIAVAELSGSARLVAAVADVRAQTSDLLDRIPLLQTNLDHSQAQHRELAEAILKGDADAAEAAAVAHLEGTERLLRGFLT
ncbi:FadR/GntR family transcriptional regulator [Arthrobacter caoxuetaonis]|uniref:FadR/GntR family transcriptional regulator n=1 Tax=Arthrobacter caoxuetaonis TaxID=2886935 RepID=UPI001D15C613|nr:FCD domain-containing protein [Arthrobacter caoxuetaonis]MCC3282226.1 GntR family transcriptional regulator [Arthrobacter caoxuetaonis]